MFSPKKTACIGFLITVHLTLTTFILQAQQEHLFYEPPPKCYTKVQILGEYLAVNEQILVKPESKKITIIPAQYKAIEEEILIKEASTKIELTPAVYKTITDTIERRPASKESPAKYQTITKQILIQPATTKTIEVPAEYQTITKQVLIAPAQMQEETVPAEYITFPKAQPISSLKYINDNYLWIEIVCDKDIDTQLIKEIQQALKDRGYYKEPINGLQNSKTEDALKKYQEDHDLPVGNISIETLKVLGVY